MWLGSFLVERVNIEAMRNMRSFTVTYVPWSNTKPARVKIHDNRNKKYVYVSYYEHEVHEHDGVESVARRYLSSIGINCTVLSEAKRGFLLLTNNFETELV